MQPFKRLLTTCGQMFVFFYRLGAFIGDFNWTILKQYTIIQEV